MPLSRRFTPEVAPGEICVLGMDFSYVIPPGVGIANCSLVIRTNAATPIDDGNWSVPVAAQSRGRVVYATVTPEAAAEGRDYQFTFTATDTDGNNWPRTALLLCAHTS